MFEKQKGQGALEYLLLMGGALLIVAIVVGIVIGISSNPTEQTERDISLLADIYEKELANLYPDSPVIMPPLGDDDGGSGDSDNEYEDEPTGLSAPAINNFSLDSSQCSVLQIIKIRFTWTPNNDVTYKYYVKVLNSSAQELNLYLNLNPFACTACILDPNLITTSQTISFKLDPSSNCSFTNYKFIIGVKNDDQPEEVEKVFSNLAPIIPVPSPTKP